MNLKKEKLDYIDSRSEALLLSTTRSSRLLIWSIFIFMAMILSWTYYAEIDQLIRGTGRVAPGQKMQSIENLEGGIVSNILVKEGELVVQNQVLIELDKTNFLSREEESSLKIGVFKAKIKRLAAEANGKKFVVQKGKLYKSLKQEHALYKKNRALVFQETLILKKQLFQKKSELKEKKESIRQLKNKLFLITKEVTMKRNLLRESVGSPSELNLAEQKLSDTQREYSVTQKSIPRLHSAVDEVNLKIRQVKIKFQKKSLEELNEAKDELAQLEKLNISKKDRVERTTLKSPVTGVIQRVLVNTIGGVVKAGESMMEIIPSTNQLIVNTKIRPSDIGFIYPNQKAIVRFSAYDFAIYGSLEGKIINISPDTIVDELDKKSYYQVQVQTTKNYLGENDEKLQLMPGMIATVDIVSGKRRVLDYILKPILRAKQNVLSER